MTNLETPRLNNIPILNDEIDTGSDDWSYYVYPSIGVNSEYILKISYNSVDYRTFYTKRKQTILQTQKYLYMNICKPGKINTTKKQVGITLLSAMPASP